MKVVFLLLATILLADPVNCKLWWEDLAKGPFFDDSFLKGGNKDFSWKPSGTVGGPNSGNGNGNGNQNGNGGGTNNGNGNGNSNGNGGGQNNGNSNGNNSGNGGGSNNGNANGNKNGNGAGSNNGNLGGNNNGNGNGKNNGNANGNENGNGNGQNNGNASGNKNGNGNGSNNGNTNGNTNGNGGGSNNGNANGNNSGNGNGSNNGNANGNKNGNGSGSNNGNLGGNENGNGNGVNNGNSNGNENGNGNGRNNGNAGGNQNGNGNGLNNGNSNGNRNGMGGGVGNGNANGNKNGNGNGQNNGNNNGIANGNDGGSNNGNANGNGGGNGNGRNNGNCNGIANGNAIGPAGDCGGGGTVVAAVNAEETAEEIPCTHLGRMCVQNATCVNHHCVCDEGMSGDGLIDCVYPGTHTCTVTADPHLTNLVAARGSLNLPCGYLLTHFSTLLNSKNPSLTHAYFEVIGFNYIGRNGRFYAKGVKILFAVGDKEQPELHQKQITFGITEHGITLNKELVAPWGTGVHESFQGVDIFLAYDMVDGFGTVTIPQAKTVFKFRPADLKHYGAQKRLPGIVIEAPSDAKFGEANTTPLTKGLCGVTSKEGGSKYLLKSTAQKLGLKNANQVLLYSMLDQHLVPEQEISQAAGCAEVRGLFNTCPKSRRSEAVKMCEGILNVPNTVKCLGDRMMSVLYICLDAVCGSELKCPVLMDAFSQAGCGIPNSIVEAGLCALS